MGFVNVKITDCTTATLIGEAVGYSELMNSPLTPKGGIAGAKQNNL